MLLDADRTGEGSYSATAFKVLGDFGALADVGAHDRSNTMSVDLRAPFSGNGDGLDRDTSPRPVEPECAALLDLASTEPAG